MRRLIRATVPVAFVALVGCTTTPAEELAREGSRPEDTIDIGALEGRIAFSADIEDVWTMNADGSNVRRVTSSARREFDPSWSPDGRWIAYRDQTGDDATTEIFVIRADGTKRRALTRNAVGDWGPDWSPDGGSIAFNSGRGSVGFGLIGIIAEPDGSVLRRIEDPFVEYPDWSPDGSRIVFMSMEPGATGSNPDYDIFVMDADGSGVRRLTDAPGQDGWPAWSPDGTRIVFSSARDDCSISSAPDCRTTGDAGPWLDVWIMDADGSNERRVTSEFGQFFTWSPDGEVILATGMDGLYVIRPDGSGMTPFDVDGVPLPLFPDWVA